MPTCDPFKLVDDFAKKLAKLRQKGLSALSSAQGSRVDFPSDLQDLLECLVVGTGDRVGVDTYAAGYEPYDLEAFRQRTRIIYESVVLSAQESRNRITGDLLHPVDTAMATSGIWLSSQVAETFHGLVAARTRRLRQDAIDLAPLLDVVSGLATDLEAAVLQIPVDAKLIVADDATILSEQTCPELVAVADALRQIAADVDASSDLGRSYCGATSLQDRVAALLAALPPRAAQTVGRALEIHRQLLDAVAAADLTLDKVSAGRDVLPAFDSQIEQANFVPVSEREIHSALAAQFEALCSEIQALQSTDRFGEMQQIIPRIQAVGAIAIDILGNGPGQRVNAVRAHPAAPFYQGYVVRLNLIAHVEKLTDRMDELQADLSLAVYGATGRVKQRISELQDAIGAVEVFRDDISRASAEYLEDADGLVNELCVGALTRLLAMSGYQEIEDKFLDGLFGEIPQLAQETATTVGQLTQCLQEFTAGACRTLPASGAQRFALERLTDVTRAAERVQDFVAEAGAKIQGQRDALTGSLDRLANAIQKDVRSAIGAASDAVPADSLALPKNFSIGTPDFPVLPRLGKPSGFDCAEDISTDADGFMKARNPVGLPPGVSLDPSGYLKQDGVEMPPAGTYRDENGYLKKLPDVGVPGRAASTLPAADSSAYGVTPQGYRYLKKSAPPRAVFAPTII